MIDMTTDAPLLRRHYKISGIVQGVGFRPFVYRLAHELGLSGWVRNSPAGVEIELQGTNDALTAFEQALSGDAPPLAVISSVTSYDIATGEESCFSIQPSLGGEPDSQIAPDAALCQDCLRELFDQADRRYRYPFITCTNCGPRYSIITGVPYDRPNTTMAGFPLCSECLNEYTDPLDRRFHAQPIACHACGPRVVLRPAVGEVVCERDEALLHAVRLLKNGAILAVKGIGGYHLAVDACNNEAVKRLRERKKRDEKPFAVMAASLEVAHELAYLDELEERLLVSPEAPVVIAARRNVPELSPLLAPNNGWLGLLLPYAPLHHLLMRDSFRALVMTSANVSDEPVAFEDRDALGRLGGIADYFLLHDRPIHLRSDDSVLRVFQGRPLFYRRSRGYAPRAITFPFAVPPLLAVGAELKSVIALAAGTRVVLSQHIGDLKNQATFDAFSQTAAHLAETMAIQPEMMVCDLHLDYLSSRFAEDSGLPLLRVQHHHAHMAACMAENGLDGDVIGVIFDGTGLGSDGTIWGGEFLTGGYDGFRRAGHFRPTPLPGSDAAVREPWRMAMAYLYQALGEDAFEADHPVARILPEPDRKLFARMLRRGINSPLTSSCGRLFDAVAALLNIRHVVSYDGQGAIELEALAERSVTSLPENGESLQTSPDQEESYLFNIVLHGAEPLQVDFAPMITAIMGDLAGGVAAAVIARRFHCTVASAASAVCLHIAASTGLNRVVLSGGVFQNRLLTEMIYTALADKGLTVYSHRLTPPNDGGIALGQAAIAARRKV
jgi:hydrogenase maturation protein HypF